MHVIRDAGPSDLDGLLELMRELAIFERYIDDFAVTKEELLKRGFGPDPEYFAVIAEAPDGRLDGMAVGYVTKFTYTLQPTITLKEFFVRKEARSSGLGAKLFTGFADKALDLGAGAIKWTVLHDNDRAKNFYQRLGGAVDPVWEPWVMDRASMERLVRASDSQ
jgi:GNAT superfamily N-acetyltransferase